MLSVKGTKVLLYGFEYEKRQGLHTATYDPPEALTRIISAPSTKVYMAEYFAPELRRNMQNTPLIGGRLEVDYEENLHDPSGAWHSRLLAAEKIAEVCENASKVVAVSDIADKPAYMYIRTLYDIAPATAIALSTAPRLIQLGAPENFFAAVAWCAVLASIYPTLLEDTLTLSGSIVRRDHPHKIEDFLFHLEDARRHFISQGIMQLASEYPGDPGSPFPSIVVGYPPAHIRRFVDNLTNPTTFDAIKRRTYKALAPGLDFAVRTWRYKDGICSSPHWEKISDRPIH